MYHTHKKKPISYLQYWSWQIVEVFCIAFLYTLIVHFVTKDTREFSEIFARAVIFVPTILIIPVIITLLYCGTRAKDEKISALESQKAETSISNSISEKAENQEISNTSIQAGPCSDIAKRETEEVGAMFQGKLNTLDKMCRFAFTLCT